MSANCLRAAPTVTCRLEEPTNGEIADVAVWVSHRLSVVVLLLSIISATVGAGAAILLGDDADPTPSASQVSPVDVVVTDEHSAATPASRELAAESEAVQASAARQRSLAQEQPAAQRQSATPDPVQQEAASNALTAAGDADAQSQPSQGALDEGEPAAQVSLVPDTLRQGESFALTVSGVDADSVMATIGGRSWNLSRVGDGDWWGILALPRDGRTGVMVVAVDLYGDDGAWRSRLSSPLLVLANPVPLEAIVLGGKGIAVDEAAVQRDHDVRFVEHVGVSGPPRWNAPWILPAEGEVSGVFGSYRSYDGVPSDTWHHGHDIAADHGDPIVAPAPGTVVWIGDLAVHGSGVIIDHGAGVHSGYWHMSLIAVRAGTEVEAGDWLGNIGTTGLSTGPHLHWEVIVRGVDVDPVQWTQDHRPPVPPVPPEAAKPVAEASGAADTLA